MSTFQCMDTQAAALRGATHEAIFDYTDLSGTAGTSLTSTLAASLVAGTAIEFVGWQLDTDFDGGATSSLTAKIGWDLGSGTDDDDGLLAAVELHADGTEVQYGPVAIADLPTTTIDETYATPESTVLTDVRTKLNTVLKRTRKVFDDTADLEVVWTASGANMTALTQGKVRFWFRICPPLAG